MASNDSLSNSSSNSNIKTDVSTTKTAALKRPSTVTEKVITPVATKSRRALTEVSVNNQISTFPDLDRVLRDNIDLTFVPLRKRQIYRDQENIEEEEQRPKRLKSDDSEECAWRDLDTDEKSDICMVVEYTNEIFSHL